MTELEKAARQALEALTDAGQLSPDEYKDKKNEAITALRQALEHLTQPPAHVNETPKSEHEQQPAGEPVACIIDGDLYYHHEIDWEDLAYQGHGVELLYTRPQPAAQWVGLTDEEIYEAQNDAGQSFRRHRMSIRGQQITPADSPDWHLARAIEAKLKEKNT